MADSQTSPVPLLNGNAAKQGQSERPSSNPQSQPKRNNRNRRNQSQGTGTLQVDGALSDSYAMQQVSPRSKRNPRHHSVAVNGQPAHIGHQSAVKQHRPVSTSGNMTPATPAKEQAYAGPTFQASPAPSSLPVPKFFSRSVPNVAVPNSLQARMAGDRTPEQQCSPEADTVSPSQPPREAQSPLDMFFRADREEKEKRRSAGNLLSPETAASYPVQPPATEPGRNFAGKSLFIHELDGHDDSDDVPSPRSIRPRRPQFERAHSSPGQSPATDSESQHEAYTRSLKDILFANVGFPPESSNPGPVELPAAEPQSRSNPSNSFETPSPFNRSRSGPNTPGPSTDQEKNYALHYGNRNLSPLFQAARNETPSRPSSLRQEVPFEPPLPNHTQSHAPPPTDPNSFSRNYLERQIQSSSQPQSPPYHQPFHGNGNSNGSSAFGQPPPTGSNFSGSNFAPPGVHVQGPSAASPRATTGSRDIGAMEDDLRRMLKLNVMS